jgi:hypothetical protein
MKRMANFLLAFLLFFSIGCTTHRNMEDITFGAPIMINLYEFAITQHQLDSICDADMLPAYEKWIKTSFIDYETDSVFTKRIYLKSYSEENEVIYILLGEKEPYKITKRIAEQ